MAPWPEPGGNRACVRSANRGGTAKIAFLFVKVGLAGADMGAAFLLPKVVGLGKATEMLYTGEFISPAEALQIGLYNRVVASDELAAETTRWAESLAAAPALR